MVTPRKMEPKKFVERTNSNDKRKIVKTSIGTVIPKFKARPDMASAWLFNKVKT